MSAKAESPDRAITVQQGKEEGFRCDFCDEEVPSVQRVALDGEYERLRTPHAVLYACPSCSRRKEQDRTRSGSG